MKCGKCGSENLPNSKFCNECGNSLINYTNTNNSNYRKYTNFDSSEGVREKDRVTMNLAKTFLNSAESFLSLGKLEDALFDSNKAINYASKINEWRVLSDIYLLQSKIYFELKNYNESFSACDSSLEYGYKSNDDTIISKIKFFKEQLRYKKEEKEREEQRLREEQLREEQRRAQDERWREERSREEQSYRESQRRMEEELQRKEREMEESSNNYFISNNLPMNYTDNSYDLPKDIYNHLAPGEKVVYSTKQNKLFFDGEEFYLTNFQIIIKDPSMMGLRKDYIHIFHDEIIDINVKENIFSANLYIQSKNKHPIIIPKIPKEEGHKIVGIIRRLIQEYKFGYLGYKNVQNVRHIFD